MDADYLHGVIDHAVSYVEGRIHTNGLENFWSLLKRSLSGTYVAVSPAHLQRYLDEQCYRFNGARARIRPGSLKQCYPSPAGGSHTIS